MQLHSSDLRKTVFLLICTMLIMIIYIGIAAATDSLDQSSSPLATATQAQSGNIIVTNGVVSYGLDQQQSANIQSGDGTITQDERDYSKVNLNGQVTIVKIKQIGVQNVDMVSSDGITNAPGSTDNTAPNKVKETFSVPSGSDYVIPPTYQVQTETSSGDINQEQIGVLKIKETPNKIKGSISLKQS